MGVNTEQIIKALECCSSRDDMACDNCPLDELNNIDCKRVLFGITLSLIKELQAHNENLKKENKYLRERLAEEAEIKEDMSVSELKSEIERMRKC